jgi:SAM-dependent methyltransferase
MAEFVFFNRTRRSASIPRALLKRGRVLEIPIYYVLRASDLAREGLDHSGSYRFADHIYQGEPSGRGWFGRWLDARLLAMPAARSFRNRFLASAHALADVLVSRADRPLDVLSAPCGLPRELVVGARLAAERRPGSLDGVTFHGLDLDTDLLPQARAFALDRGLPNFTPHAGDALRRESYPAGADFITCTGLAEFLDDARFETLLRVFADVLRPGGRLVTSAMKRHWASAYLLRLAELEPHYRTPDDLAAISGRVPFETIDIHMDDAKLQSILVATR